MTYAGKMQSLLKPVAVRFEPRLRHGPLLKVNTKWTKQPSVRISQHVCQFRQGPWSCKNPALAHHGICFSGTSSANSSNARRRQHGPHQRERPTYQPSSTNTSSMSFSVRAAFSSKTLRKRVRKPSGGPRSMSSLMAGVKPMERNSRKLRTRDKAM